MDKASKCKKERYEDPFIYEKNISDSQFWNDFQSDFYETVILPKKKHVIPMQWIDWDYMAKNNDPASNEVIAACEHKKVKKIMAL